MVLSLRLSIRYCGSHGSLRADSDRHVPCQQWQVLCVSHLRSQVADFIKLRYCPIYTVLLRRKDGVLWPCIRMTLQQSTVAL